MAQIFLKNANRKEPVRKYPGQDESKVELADTMLKNIILFHEMKHYKVTL